LADWTTAVDDGLTARLTQCTLCGDGRLVLWGVCGTLHLALAYVLCHRCKESGGVGRVEVLFAQRYEAGT